MYVGTSEDENRRYDMMADRLPGMICWRTSNGSRRSTRICRIMAIAQTWFTSKRTLESYMKSSSYLVCWKKLEWESPICGTFAEAIVSLRPAFNDFIFLVTLPTAVNLSAGVFLFLASFCFSSLFPYTVAMFQVARPKFQSHPLNLSLLASCKSIVGEAISWWVLISFGPWPRTLSMLHGKGRHVSIRLTDEHRRRLTWQTRI
jgi:hypothetical protein